MSKAIVILSGGQDSTTCLYWARQRYDEVHTLTFDYGQRHAIELEAAARIATIARVESHEVVDLRNVLRSTSPLTDSAIVLETYTDFASMDATIGSRVELTFVPMRNMLFLTIAANRAVALGAEAIVTGICQADNANYPDCRDIFAFSMEETIALALGTRRLDVVTPLMFLSKADTVKLAASIPYAYEALAYSHTCYAGKFPPCGECHACVLRAHGFAEAGMADPLLERIRGLV